MREISAPEMGIILGPLEKMFKPLSEFQRELYHEKLKYLPEKYLKEAVEYWLDFGKSFPRPGELKKDTWKARAADPSYKEESTEVEGCAHCRYGWVNFTMWGNTEHTTMRLYQKSQPCAYCHKEHNLPMVILRDGHIFWANKQLRSGRYVQDLNSLTEVSGSFPGDVEDRLKYEESRQKKKDEETPF